MFQSLSHEELKESTC